MSNEGHKRERQRHLGAVGLQKLPLVLLRLAMRLFGSHPLGSGIEPVQLRLNPASVVDPVAEGERGCYGPKAEDRRKGCRVNLVAAMQQSVEHHAICNKVGQ